MNDALDVLDDDCDPEALDDGVGDRDEPNDGVTEGVGSAVRDADADVVTDAVPELVGVPDEVAL